MKDCEAKDQPGSSLGIWGMAQAIRRGIETISRRRKPNGGGDDGRRQSGASPACSPCGRRSARSPARTTLRSVSRKPEEARRTDDAAAIFASDSKRSVDARAVLAARTAVCELVVEVYGVSQVGTARANAPTHSVLPSERPSDGQLVRPSGLRESAQASAASDGPLGLGPVIERTAEELALRAGSRARRDGLCTSQTSTPMQRPRTCWTVVVWASPPTVVDEVAVAAPQTDDGAQAAVFDVAGMVPVAVWVKEQVVASWF